ncbi:MAG: hypothetical protein AAF799_11180 [Myxococcota bacterium]
MSSSTSKLYLVPPLEPGSFDWQIWLTEDEANDPYEKSAHVNDGTRYLVVLEGMALAECTAHHLSEVYLWSDGSGDHDNYVVLRIEVVLDSERWQTLPWGHRSPGELFYGWSHYEDEMIRDDPEGIGWKMASWEEVEQALAAGECRLEYFDGHRHPPKPQA